MSSSKEIAALKPREKRYSVAIENGLTLRVHPSGSKIVGDHVYRAYQRSDFLESRKNVMERWCSYVLFCAEAGQRSCCDHLIVCKSSRSKNSVGRSHVAVTDSD